MQVILEARKAEAQERAGSSHVLSLPAFTTHACLLLNTLCRCCHTLERGDAADARLMDEDEFKASTASVVDVGNAARAGGKSSFLSRQKVSPASHVKPSFFSKLFSCADQLM